MELRQMDRARDGREGQLLVDGDDQGGAGLGNGSVEEELPLKGGVGARQRQLLDSDRPTVTGRHCNQREFGRQQDCAIRGHLGRRTSGLVVR